MSEDHSPETQEPLVVESEVEASKEDATIAVLRDKLNRTRSSASSYRQRLQRTQERFTEIRSAVEAEKQKSSSLRKENAKLTQQVEALREREARLNSWLASKGEQNDTLRNKLDESRLSATNYRQRLIRTQERFEELRLALAEAKTSLSTARKAEQLPQSTSEITAEAERLEGIIRILRDREKDLRKKLAASRAGATTYRKRLQRTQERFGEIRKVLESHKSQLRNTRIERNRIARKAAAGEAAQGYFQDITKGVEQEIAYLNYIRRSTDSEGRIETRCFAHWLLDTHTNRDFAEIANGIFQVGDDMFETAQSYFEQAGIEQARSLAPVESLTACMATQGDKALASVSAWLEKANFQEQTEEVFLLLKQIVRFGFYDTARDLCAKLQGRQKLSQSQQDDLLWISERLGRSKLPVSLPAKTISIAVMDYKLVDKQRTSSNRGDYVQTLAALANILRFQNVEYVGGTPLDSYLNSLKERIPAPIRLGENSQPVQAAAIPLDRDFASGRSYPPNTWLLCNGWFMHRNFKGQIDFPFPKEINPIYISFHINDPSVLTEEVASNLRKAEPIGCRDWTTVYRLREFGIECFFSGCMTTTIGQIMPQIDRTQADAIAAVESRVPMAKYPDADIEEFVQFGDYVRDLDLVAGLQDADAMLQGYLPFSKVLTSRLHCYLPCRSMGLDVDFVPRNTSDIRFEGLLDLDSTKFDKIRKNIEEKLEKVMAAIFEGQDKDSVMALWRELCAEDVIAAEAYCTNFKDASLPLDQVDTIAQQPLATSARAAPPNAVHVAFAMDDQLMDHFPVALSSALEHCSRPLAIHLQHRNIPQAYLDALTSAFPRTSFTFYDMNQVDYGQNLRMLSHTTVSTMDRCLLPTLCPQLDKIIYLDVDILIRDDLAGLDKLDMQGAMIAGKLSQHKDWNLIVRLVTRASLSLEHSQAWALRRRLHAQYPLYSQTFNAGVIVMNLEMMRAEQIPAHALYLIKNCCFNDQDALNVLGAGRIRALDPSWNFVPAQEWNSDPKIVHWAGVTKPWHDKPTLWQKEYLAAARKAPDLTSLHSIRD